MGRILYCYPTSVTEPTLPRPQFMTPEGVQAIARGAEPPANSTGNMRHSSSTVARTKRGREEGHTATATRRAPRPPCGHPRVQAAADRPLCCDACGADIECGEPAASCRPCDYDECLACCCCSSAAAAAPPDVPLALCAAAAAAAAAARDSSRFACAGDAPPSQAADDPHPESNSMCTSSGLQVAASGSQKDMPQPRCGCAGVESLPVPVVPIGIRDFFRVRTYDSVGML